MTFKYGLTLAARGGNKLSRFKAWAETALPDLEYLLPPQTPIETETLTIRLRSLEDRRRILEALPGTLPGDPTAAG
jgi:hypothetical protein